MKTNYQIASFLQTGLPHRKSIFAILIIFCLTAKYSRAQKFNWVKPNISYITWADTFESIGIETDDSGNSYSLLSFRTTEFVLDGDTVENNGSQNLLVLKYNSEGILQWAVPFGSPIQNSFPGSIKLNGNTILVLYSPFNEPTEFPDTTVMPVSDWQFAEFDLDGNFSRLIPAPQYSDNFGQTFDTYQGNIYYATSNTGDETAISRIDPSGNVDSILGISFIGTFSGPEIYYLKITPEGDIMASGTYSGTINIGNTSLANFSQNSWGSSHFYFRADSNGMVKWATRSSSLESLQASMADDDEMTYIGMTNAEAAFYFGEDSINLGSEHGSLLVKLDSAGNLIWNRAWNCTGTTNYSYNSCDLHDLYVSAESDIFALGRYQGSSVSPYAPSLLNPDQDYLLKIDSSGTINWFTGFNNYGSGSLIHFAPSSGNSFVILHDMVPDSSHFGCLETDSTYGGFFIASLTDTAGSAPDVAFSYNKDFQTIYCEANVNAANELEWNFGDGEISNQLNPSHHFSGPGIYNVCLSARNNCGINQQLQTVSIAGIESISPSIAGNTGWVIVDVYGVNFTSTTSVSLSKPGFATIFPENIIFVDSTHFRATFRFNNTPIGIRDVSVVIPDEGIFNLVDGFEIDTLNGFKPWVEISSPLRVLTGSTTTVTFAVGNSGNETGYGVLLGIKFPGNVSVNLLSDFIHVEVDPSIESLLSPTHFYLYHDSITGDSANICALVIPVLAPGAVSYVPVSLQALSNIALVDIQARVFPKSLYDNAFFDNHGYTGITATCDILPPCIKCAMDLGGEIPLPPLSCFLGGFNIGCAMLDIFDAIGNVNVNNYITGNCDFIASMWSTVIDCTPAGAALKGITKMANNFVEKASALDGYIDLASDCIECASDDDGGGGSAGQSVEFVSSLDPNLKNGPSGFGSNAFIDRNSSLYYNVYFENADSATSPANQVIITDQLDTAHVDLSTFKFTGFTIGDSTFTSGIEEKAFVHDYDLRPTRNCILRTVFELNDSTGIAKWRFTSLDPVTFGALPDPFDGFLPPNVTNPEGQASVTYHIAAKHGLPHNTVISNAADIIFDYNLPITTPAWINTIDAEKPQSNVLALPATMNDTSFWLHWTGNDADAGIQDYRIYVSDNDSAYYLWMSNTKSDSALFTGQFGHQYEFYSIARDYVSNIEDVVSNPEQNPDAVTTIIASLHTYFQDADSDGFGNAGVRLMASLAPAGYVSDSSDCNDSLSTIHPGAAEICNGIDDDCNGLIDDGSALPSSAGAISGPTMLCPNQTGITYSVQPIEGAQLYTWNLPPGILPVTGTQVTSSNFITVRTDSTFNGQYFRVMGSNQCGSGMPSPLFSVGRYTAKPSTPAAINGLTGNAYGYCAGETYTFSSSSSQASRYHWTYFPAILMSSSDTGNSITVQMPVNFSGCVISVYASNCIGSGSTRSLTLKTVPSQPQAITGPTNNIVCPLGNTFTFSIPALPAGATYLVWTASGGATITSSSGTSASIYFPANPLFTSSVITVAGANNCGTGPIRTITVTSNPPSPGTIAGAASICKLGAPVQVYSITSVPSADGYVWSASSSSITFSTNSTGPFSSTLTTSGTSVFADFSSSATGSRSIKVLAFNSCGSGTIRTKTVTVSSCREVEVNPQVRQGFLKTIYPNPATNQMTIKFFTDEIESYSLTLNDLLGRKIMLLNSFTTKGENSISINVSDLNKGMYILQVEKSGVTEARQVIID